MSEEETEMSSDAMNMDSDEGDDFDLDDGLIDLGDEDLEEAENIGNFGFSFDDSRDAE